MAYRNKDTMMMYHSTNQAIINGGMKSPRGMDQ